jgi:expansin (peptidoglycan-binding protein)
VGIWGRGVGNCSYPVPAVDDYVAALDLNLYAKGARCGSCLEVATAKGSVVVRVVDSTSIPGSGNQLSISEIAFRKIAPANSGLVQANWRWVPCEAMTDIMGALKGDSGQYYWAAIFDNVVNPIAKLEYLSKGNDMAWKEAKREHDNYFYCPMAQGLPTRFRLTDTTGQVRLTNTPLVWANPIDKYMSLGVQFSPVCSR